MTILRRSHTFLTPKNFETVCAAQFLRLYHPFGAYQPFLRDFHSSPHTTCTSSIWAVLSLTNKIKISSSFFTPCVDIFSLSTKIDVRFGIDFPLQSSTFYVHLWTSIRTSKGVSNPMCHAKFIKIIQTNKHTSTKFKCTNKICHTLKFNYFVANPNKVQPHNRRKYRENVMHTLVQLMGYHPKTRTTSSKLFSSFH